MAQDTQKPVADEVEPKAPIETETASEVTTAAPAAENAPVEEDEDDDTAILEMKAEVQAKIDAKKGEEKMYTQKEVDERFAKLEKKFSKMRDSDDEDFIDLLDPNAVKRKFIRIARLNDKFVVALKDMNNDSYSDQPIFITNIKGPDPKDGMIPWATLMYDDGTEELYPYLSFMNRSVGVWGEVIDEQKTDVSEKFGLVDMKDIDDKNEWNMKSNGKRVLAKALKYNVTYTVRDIKQGKILKLSQDVINKVEAPYSDLNKFIEATQ